MIIYSIKGSITMTKTAYIVLKRLALPGGVDFPFMSGSLTERCVLSLLLSRLGSAVLLLISSVIYINYQ